MALLSALCEFDRLKQRKRKRRNCAWGGVEIATRGMVHALRGRARVVSANGKINAELSDCAGAAGASLMESNYFHLRIAI